MAAKNLRTLDLFGRSGIVGDAHPRKEKIGWRCKDSEVHLEGSMVHMIYVPNDTSHHTVHIIMEGDN